MVRMWWSNLLCLSARIIGLVGLTFLFGRCEIAAVDAIPPVVKLTKGRLYVDPVVKTTPVSLSLIRTLKNTYGDNMEAFSKTSRPASISDYNPKVVEPIVQNGLPAHVFQWQNTGQPVMMVAVFREVVRVDATTNEISNKEALVWLWTPLKGSIDPGQITFKEGKTAAWNKETNTYVLSSPAMTLATGYYVWCVLAWDKQGINIIAASRELPINIVLK